MSFLKRAGLGLDSEAVAIVRKMKLKPLLKQGRPLPSEVTVRVLFPGRPPMRLVAALVILIASSAAAAAFTLSGSVFDADSGRPLNNATVGIMEHGAVAESGSGGVFVIRDIPRSVCTVTVTATGYRAYERKIRLNRDRSITVRMEKDPYLQELISPLKKKKDSGL